jgi:hypothetical protein
MPSIAEVSGSFPAAFDPLSGDVAFYLFSASLLTLYAGSQTLTKDGSLPEIPGQLSEHLPRHGTRAD